MITRQHSNTTIPELSGAICIRLIGSSQSLNEPVRVMYLQVLGGNWHRFDFDTQVLFWVEGAAPNPGDDLDDDDQQYLDYGLPLGVVDKRIASIEMRDLGPRAELRIAFDEGPSIVFDCIGDVAHVRLSD